MAAGAGLGRRGRSAGSVGGVGACGVLWAVRAGARGVAAGAHRVNVGIPPNRGDIVYEETCHTHDASSTRSSGPVLCAIVRETRRPVVESPRDLGIGAGTLGNWVRKDRIERGGAEGLSSVRQTTELSSSGCASAATELEMERRCAQTISGPLGQGGRDEPQRTSRPKGPTMACLTRCRAGPSGWRRRRSTSGAAGPRRRPSGAELN